MCRRVLLVVLWLLIGTRSRLLVVWLLSIAETLCPSRCLFGTILVTLCLIVCDWRVSRAEPMLSCRHDLLCLFCLLLFHLFLPSMGWLCGVGVFGLMKCSHSLPALIGLRNTVNNNNNNNNNNKDIESDHSSVYSLTQIYAYTYVNEVLHYIENLSMLQLCTKAYSFIIYTDNFLILVWQHTVKYSKISAHFPSASSNSSTSQLPLILIHINTWGECKFHGISVDFMAFTSL